ncbi:MAG: cysteine desulfurase family protein [Candidatus Neomarinimicrobiota bacterium]
MKKKIYLDNNATTPTDPAVVEAMTPYFLDKFGNASSRNHYFGWEAQDAVENSRRLISNELNCRSREVVFTSGATEGITLAIKGFCERNKDKGSHIITQVTEHKAVLDTCSEMEKNGWKVTFLPVENDGRVSPERINDSINKQTVLISIMHANNEIGSINNILEIGKICKENNIRFMVDAAQSFGKLAIDVDRMNIDLLSASAHKIYGPKGIGFLYVRQRNPKVEIKLQIFGGGHERNMRSGTLPVPLIVGLAKATQLITENQKLENKRLMEMRDELINKVRDAIPDTIINGSLEHRLPHNINFSFPNIEGEALLMKLESIACSSGSACTSATLQPSYVMKALGHSEELAHSSIRIAFGRMNQDEDVQIAADEIINAVTELRGKSLLYQTSRSDYA